MIETETFKYKMYLTNLVSEVHEEMEKIIEMGTVSSRGQIAIPSEVRKILSLSDGSKVLFAVEKDTLIIKKFDTEKTWEEVTKPLREAAKKSGLKESDIPGIVKRFHKSKNK
jgi:AbrB family looped-hinge helix DNA binding protein